MHMIWFYWLFLCLTYNVWLTSVVNTEFNEIGMSINSQKSSYIKIGPRRDINMPVSNNQTLSCKQEFSYLGIFIWEYLFWEYLFSYLGILLEAERSN